MLSSPVVRLQVAMSLYRLSTVHSHIPQGRTRESELNLAVYTFMPLRFGNLLHSLWSSVHPEVGDDFTQVDDYMGERAFRALPVDFPPDSPRQSYDVPICGSFCV